MFFNLELLCRQGKGKFAIPWLAATRGINKLSRKDIESVNIPELCDELQKMILSESNKARKRISLSLSAKLVHGLTALQNKQASMLLDDTVNLLHNMNSPLLEKPVQRKPKAHVANVKDKHKKSKIVLTAEIAPEAQHIFTADDVSVALAEVARASVDSITLREDFPTRISRDETGFGDLGGIEAEMHIQKAGHTLSKSSSQFQTIVEEIIGAQHPQPSAELELQDGEPVFKRPRIEPPAAESMEIAVVAPAETREPSTSVVVQAGDVEASVVLPKKTHKIVAKRDEKFYINEETKRKTIWRKFDVASKRNTKETFLLIELIDLRGIDPCLYKGDVMIGERESARISLRLSSMRNMGERRSGTPTLQEEEIPPAVTKDLVTSVDMRPSSMDVILETSQEALEQIMQPVPASSTPIFEDKVAPPLEMEKTLEPVREQAISSPTDSVQSRKTAKERQLAIVRVIQKWSFEERDLTIEYLCDSPRTWIKFAVIFEDILYMSKLKYVKLICHQNSIELRCIEKASRLQ